MQFRGGGKRKKKDTDLIRDYSYRFYYDLWQVFVLKLRRRPTFHEVVIVKIYLV